MFWSYRGRYNISYTRFIQKVYWQWRNRWVQGLKSTNEMYFHHNRMNVAAHMRFNNLFWSTKSQFSQRNGTLTKKIWSRLVFPAEIAAQYFACPSDVMKDINLPLHCCHPAADSCRGSCLFSDELLPATIAGNEVFAWFSSEIFKAETSAPPEPKPASIIPSDRTRIEEESLIDNSEGLVTHCRAQPLSKLWFWTQLLYQSAGLQGRSIEAESGEKMPKSASEFAAARDMREISSRNAEFHRARANIFEEQRPRQTTLNGSKGRWKIARCAWLLLINWLTELANRKYQRL